MLIIQNLQVLWTAPPPGAGCIAIRATVIEHRDIWYRDDGPLSKVLCEDEVDSIDSQPAIMEECCACDEAKYELTFEGLWSRHTHPKDFPSNGWLTRFSDVIGASHTVDYRFWDYGRRASEGLQQIAEHGSTRKLEFELKDEVRYENLFKTYGLQCNFLFIECTNSNDNQSTWHFISQRYWKGLKFVKNL